MYESDEWLQVESLDLEGQGVAHRADGKVVDQLLAARLLLKEDAEAYLARANSAAVKQRFAK